MDRLTRTGFGVLAAGLMLGALAVSAAPGEAVQHQRVTLADYAFSPSTVTVAAGRPVLLELVNRDSLTPHNFTLEHPDAGMDIDVDVPAGETRSVRFTPSKAGRYGFHCDKKLMFLKSHRERGMRGTLVVVP
jgi:plastocyanin